MTGFLQGGVCYADEQSALSAYHASPVDVQLNQDYILQTQTIFELDSYYQLHTIFDIDSTPIQSYTKLLPLQTFPSCEILNDPFTNFMDGHQLGWGVATVMIIAFAIRSIHRR